MNYQTILDKYYPADDALRRLLLTHSRLVADRCLLVCDRHPELRLDRQFVEEASMLHDIGIRWCSAPSIFCEGTEPYIRHGYIGGQVLRREGFSRHARVCERHTGTGLSREQIEQQHLPLPLPPAEDCPPAPQGSWPYEPEYLEEQLVCYADKFYSKSHPDRVMTVADTARSLERFGPEGVKKFLEWASLFE